MDEAKCFEDVLVGDDEDIILERARYEELLSKGFVEEGKILEDKPLFKKEEKED